MSRCVLVVLLAWCVVPLFLHIMFAGDSKFVLYCDVIYFVGVVFTLQ